MAPFEIVHTLDLTCILPPRADGVPVWKSDKIGEDFIIKFPNYLAPYIEAGKPLCEEMGAAFATWAKGGSAAPVRQPAGAADIYWERWLTIISGATNPEQLSKTWNDQADERKSIAWTEEHSFQALKTKVGNAINFLKQPA